MSKQHKPEQGPPTPPPGRDSKLEVDERGEPLPADDPEIVPSPEDELTIIPPPDGPPPPAEGP